MKYTYFTRETLQRSPARVPSDQNYTKQELYQQPHGHAAPVYTTRVEGEDETLNKVKH